MVKKMDCHLLMGQKLMVAKHVHTQGHKFTLGNWMMAKTLVIGSIYDKMNDKQLRQQEQSKPRLSFHQMGCKHLPA